MHRFLPYRPARSLSNVIFGNPVTVMGVVAGFGITIVGVSLCSEVEKTKKMILKIIPLSEKLIDNCKTVTPDLQAFKEEEL